MGSLDQSVLEKILPLLDPRFLVIAGPDEAL